MSARDDILASVRGALAQADVSEVHVPRAYRDTRAADGRTLDQFVDNVEDYRAVVVRCAPDEVEARIAEALPDGARTVVPHGLPWQVPGAVTDDALSALELDGLDAVVTGATVGIATTGTIVLSHGAGQGRRALSLVPDMHVCVVRADQVVADVPDAFALLDPGRPSTWISGPSATSDIELDRVEGVHGPRRLHVIVAG
ncbi:MAG TPA: lactate utilization protein C [Nocardioidaceae bacterium]|nr:lactate utilization protein C [Nocardioidaceae bacterium]